MQHVTVSRAPWRRGRCGRRSRTLLPERQAASVMIPGRELVSVPQSRTRYVNQERDFCGQTQAWLSLVSKAAGDFGEGFPTSAGLFPVAARKRPPTRNGQGYAVPAKLSAARRPRDRTHRPTAGTRPYATSAGGHRLSRMRRAVRAAPSGLPAGRHRERRSRSSGCAVRGRTGESPTSTPDDVLTARQSSHASHAQRDRPPAVARKQMMHRSCSRETSHPSHFSGESSSRHDCHVTGNEGPPTFFVADGPRNPPHGICTDNSVMRSRSAASVALSFRSVIFRHSWQRHPRASTTCTRYVPALPLGHRAVEARLPGRRARYPNSRPLVSDSRIRQDPDGIDRCCVPSDLRLVGPEPRWSMRREPRRDDHTTCTAIAPDAVFNGTHVGRQRTLRARN